jgi:hypothetical protein
MSTPANFPQEGQLYQELAAVIVGLRNQCEAAANLWMLIGSVGGAAGLEADVPGFTSSNAPAFVAAVDYAYTMYGLFNGQVAQATPFNFYNALAEYAGGQ